MKSRKVKNIITKLHLRGKSAHNNHHHITLYENQKSILARHAIGTISATPVRMGY